MKSVHDLSVLSHTPHMQTVVKKLPYYLQREWLKHAVRLKEKRIPNFKDLSDFVEDAAEAENDPVYSIEALHGRNLKKAPNNISFSAGVEGTYTTLATDDPNSCKTTDLTSKFRRSK